MDSAKLVEWSLGVADMSSVDSAVVSKVVSEVLSLQTPAPGGGGGDWV